jgi:hypothetical protein
LASVILLARMVYLAENNNATVKQLCLGQNGNEDNIGHGCLAERPSMEDTCACHGLLRRQRFNNLYELDFILVWLRGTIPNTHFHAACLLKTVIAAEHWLWIYFCSNLRYVSDYLNS